MNLFWRTDAQHAPDPVNEERLCGLEPPTLDELAAEQLDREDRLSELHPASSRHLDDTAPMLTNGRPPGPEPLPCNSLPRGPGTGGHQPRGD